MASIFEFVCRECNRCHGKGGINLEPCVCGCGMIVGDRCHTCDGTGVLYEYVETVLFDTCECERRDRCPDFVDPVDGLTCGYCGMPVA